MSYSIFIANPAALIAQPGRAVNTFPSGLVRVDQTYLGLTSQAATHRATLAVGNSLPDGNSSPCIDGLKIFPEVQTRCREGGFTEYLVSAYGRSTAGGQKTFSKELGVQAFVAGFTSPSGQSVQNYEIEVTCDLLVWKFVAPKSASPDVTISDDLRIYRLDGSELSTVQISEFFSVSNLAGIDKPTSVSFSTPQKITLAQAVNFGEFDEWTVVYKATPVQVALGGWEYTAGPSQPSTYNPVIPAAQVGAYIPLGMEANGASQLTLYSVYNINSPSFSYNSSTPRSLISLDNTEVATYLGGTVRIHNSNLHYTKPQISRPADQTITNSSAPSGPSQITAGAFTFVRYLKTNSGDMQVYSWRMQSIHEVFEITFENENGQAGTYKIAVLFSE